MQPGPPYNHPQGAPKKSTNWLILLVVIGGLVFLVLPVGASLAIYSVRRYLAAAKTSEAKNTIGAIARGARQSFEREHEPGDDGAVHRLCGTAVPVPAAVPAGLKYQPGTGGVDFDTGDAFTGWKCLKFSMTMPMYYQYSYTKGASPILAAHGGSKAVSGAESFEAAAQGDLDGDGATSAFALVGEKDAAGEMRLATQVFVRDEYE